MRSPVPDIPLMLAFARVLFAVLAFAAIGCQLALHIGASYSVTNFFSYFTNLSNLVAASVLLFSAFATSSRVGRSRDLARYVSAVNMTVVGLVFAVLLRNVDLGALLPWVNAVLHYVMPVVIVLDWLVAPPASRLKAGHLVLVFAFPAFYLAYVVVRGASTGWYPYPFLDPSNVGGYSGVALYSLGITVTFLVAGLALLVIGNRLSTAPAHDAFA